MLQVGLCVELCRICVTPQFLFLLFRNWSCTIGCHSGWEDTTFPNMKVRQKSYQVSILFRIGLRGLLLEGGCGKS